MMINLNLNDDNTEILTKLHSKTYFSKINLRKSFHQIPMNLEDIYKTAVIAPFGLFEYLTLELPSQSI